MALSVPLHAHVESQNQEEHIFSVLAWEGWGRKLNSALQGRKDEEVGGQISLN